MREDFEEHLLPWAAQFPDRLRLPEFTWDRFRTAASWVASRAFGVDGWHGASCGPRHLQLASESGGFSECIDHVSMLTVRVDRAKCSG